MPTFSSIFNGCYKKKKFAFEDLLNMHMYASSYLKKSLLHSYTISVTNFLPYHRAEDPNYVPSCL